MNIGLVVRALRLERRLSQEALALEVDTATSNLSRIESGSRTPSLDLLYRLASALNASLSEIFHAVESGEMGTTGENMILPLLGDPSIPDYDDKAVQMRCLFRELNSDNREIAIELLKALKNVQVKSSSF